MKRIKPNILHTYGLWLHYKGIESMITTFEYGTQRHQTGCDTQKAQSIELQ
jgi:hypothetical protein